MISGSGEPAVPVPLSVVASGAATTAGVGTAEGDADALGVEDGVALLVVASVALGVLVAFEEVAFDVALEVDFAVAVAVGVALVVAAATAGFFGGVALGPLAVSLRFT